MCEGIEMDWAIHENRLIIQQYLGFSVSGDGCRVAEDQNNGVSSEEEFSNVSVLVDWLSLLLAFACLGHLRPHLLHILQDHIEVAIKGLHSGQQLAIVTTIDQHLDRWEAEARSNTQSLQN